MSTTDKFLRAKAFGKSYELDQAINELCLVLFKDEFITRNIIKIGTQGLDVYRFVKTDDDLQILSDLSFMLRYMLTNMAGEQAKDKEELKDLFFTASILLKGASSIQELAFTFKDVARFYKNYYGGKSA
ncbi:hypothetical protein [Campylobacter concisus]|mgnify:FL=1|uniref:hypothetical protein n=1 Tax=Campylobacter concisus TaxID=199 RepID=UPI0018834D7E|nr:hypothetical protein [Campylobacter concisus]MBE9857626.1 hypothetical protein [Campylobacter concisus]